MVEVYQKSSKTILHSGVARASCALGQEIFLRPLQQNLQSLNQKISAKVRQKQRQNICCSYFSGVARVPCALGQEIYLRPRSTKILEFEVKNSCKNLEDAKFVLFLKVIAI